MKSWIFSFFIPDKIQDNTIFVSVDKQKGSLLVFRHILKIFEIISAPMPHGLFPFLNFYQNQLK